jgi:hypothetical protein
MSHPRYSSAEIAQRGQAIYDREVSERLAASAFGKFLALDVETGSYEIDSDELEALKRARAKHPDAVLYLLRIGHPTAYRLGRKAVATA